MLLDGTKIVESADNASLHYLIYIHLALLIKFRFNDGIAGKRMRNNLLLMITGSNLYVRVNWWKSFYSQCIMDIFNRICPLKCISSVNGYIQQNMSVEMYIIS